MARRRSAVPESQDGGSPQEGAAEQPGTAGGVGESTGEGQAEAVDLTQFEEFRKWQAKQNQQLDALRQQLETERQMREQEARQRQQYEQQFEQQNLDRMSEPERLKYQMEQQQRRIQEYEQQLTALREREARQAALTQISQATGVPVEAFADAPDPLTAAIKVIQEWQARNQQPTQPTAQEAPGQAQTGGYNIAPGTRLPDMSRPGNQPHTPFVGPGAQKHSDPTPEQKAQKMFEQYAGQKGVDPAIAHEYVKLIMESGNG